MLNDIGSNLNIARSTEQLSKVSLHIIKVSLFGESRFKYIVTLESVDRLEDSLVSENKSDFDLKCIKCLEHYLPKNEKLQLKTILPVFRFIQS